MSVELLTEHYLEFLSLKGGCTGSSESTLVKMPHCWKSHVAAQFINLLAKEGLLALVQLTNLALAQSTINRGSYMSAHVLLNLLNELGKRDKV